MDGIKEKEIEKGLECCAEFLCDECPYQYLDSKDYYLRCTHRMIVDVASLYKNLKTKKEVHGKWILLDECSNAGVYCSVCHKKVYKENYANQKLKSKYCPNCNAIMDL